MKFIKIAVLADQINCIKGDVGLIELWSTALQLEACMGFSTLSGLVQRVNPSLALMIYIIVNKI
jgi:hypothetical protein